MQHLYFSHPRAALAAAIAFMSCLWSSLSFAQTSRPAIALNFPSSVEVKVLVDYISARTGLNIVYDDELLKKAGTVAIRSPNKMSVDQLPAFLTEVLRMNGLGLAIDARTGWTRSRAMVWAWCTNHQADSMMRLHITSGHELSLLEVSNILVIQREPVSVEVISPRSYGRCWQAWPPATRAAVGMDGLGKRCVAWIAPPQHCPRLYRQRIRRQTL